MVEIGRTASRRDRRRPLGGRGLHVRQQAQEDHRRGYSATARPSIRLIAQKIGQETLLPSLQLALEDPGANSSNCGEGYSCAYTNSISWSSPTQPLPMELDPQVAFERLFGSGGKLRRARRAPRAGPQHSRFRHAEPDPVQEGSGRGDRARLDEYETDIREIERRLELAKKSSGQAEHRWLRGARRRAGIVRRAREAALRPAGAGFPRRHHARFDRALCPRSDGPLLSRRAASTAASTARRITRRIRQNIERYSHINQYHVKCLAYFVDKLKKTNDGDGTLLDHSLILYGTNMGDSNQHLHYDVPHILVGGASGQLKGGRHLAYPTKTITTGNLLLSILGHVRNSSGQYRRQHGPAWSGSGLSGRLEERD